MLFIAAAVWPAGTAGQICPDDGTVFNLNSSGTEYQQEAVAIATGHLRRVYLTAGAPGSATFTLNRGTPWQTDANDYQGTFTAVSPGWRYIDVSSANIYLAEGEHVVIGLTGAGTSP